jgi:hypothetical protein
VNPRSPAYEAGVLSALSKMFNIFSVHSIARPESYFAFFRRMNFHKALNALNKTSTYVKCNSDCLCGLVVRVLDYRSRGHGFDSRALQKKSSESGTGSTQPREYN